MTKIDITPVEQMIANLCEENERLREGLEAARTKCLVDFLEGEWAREENIRLRAENATLFDVNRLQVHQIDVAHARIDYIEEQLRKAQQRAVTMRDKALEEAEATVLHDPVRVAGVGASCRKALAENIHALKSAARLVRGGE